MQGQGQEQREGEGQWEGDPKNRRREKITRPKVEHLLDIGGQQSEVEEEEEFCAAGEKQ